MKLEFQFAEEEEWEGAVGVLIRGCGSGGTLTLPVVG